MTHVASARFTTLDVFRGMTVFLMIVVNTPGSGAEPYPPLLHAAWNGCTLTDLVFPSFLFAVGNAMAFSMKKYKSMNDARVLFKIFKRSFLIFIIGYLLTWYCTMHWDAGGLAFQPFNQTRIMAVLQRIALCYGFAAIIVHYCSSSSLIILSVSLLLIYWFLLYIFGEDGGQYTVTGNAVRHADLLLLGERHMYRERGEVFDPEGLLSTIPAIVNVLAGYIAGKFIMGKGKTFECMAKLLLFGNILILGGLIWDYFLPMNKKLWTSSYAVFTTGIDLVSLGFLFYLFEIKSLKTGVRFFSVFGKNALFIYILSTAFIFLFIIKLAPDTILYDWINAAFFQQIAPGPFGSLLFAVSFTLVCWIFGWVLDKKKIYMRI